jgi:peroxiredoxin
VARPLDFALADHRGGTFRLSEALRERTTVVLFYRGDW